MTKTILILAIVASFVVGSIMTGTMASAQQAGVGDNLIIDALNSITAAITGIPDPTVTVNVDPTPVDIVVNAPQGEQGIQGEQGEQGIQGPQGEQGMITASSYTVSRTANIPAQGSSGQTVQCNTGDLRTGGGVSALHGFALIFLNGPQGDNDWAGSARNFGDVADSLKITVLCLDTAFPPHIP